MKNIVYFPFLFLAVLLFATCEKFEVKPVTKVETGTATPQATSLTVNAKIIDLSGEGNTDHGFCYSTHNEPSIDDFKVSKGNPKVGDFAGSIDGLTLNTQYYIRAYCLSDGGTVYGETVVITTLNGVISLTTTAATSITATTASSGGNITSDGGAPVTARGVVWSTSQNPTSTNNQGISSNGTGTGTYTSNITGLLQATTYYVRAYATNSFGTQYGNQVNFLTIDGITDADGNIYNTIWINGRQWMKENLKTTKYCDGSSIPNVTDNGTWAGLSTPAYCWYNNDIANKPTYGALYNWYAVNTDNLCPTGWHVPTDAEWYAMENYVDPTINDPSVIGWRGTDGGTKLKATSGWNSRGNGTDIYGFSALPGGYRGDYGGSFSSVGYGGSWWSCTEGGAASAWYRSVESVLGSVLRSNYDKESGYSVRCVRDN